MEFIFIIFWIIVVVVINAAKKSKGGAQRSGQQRPPVSAQQPQSYDAQQVGIDRMRQASQGKQTFRSVPGSTYGSSNTAKGRPASSGGSQFRSGQSFSDMSRAYSLGQTKASRLAETGVLLEDRKNDWLARQLREEAAIYRRGSMLDLGASHQALCEAGYIKKEHTRHHNSNGLDKRTFR